MQSYSAPPPHDDRRVIPGMTTEEARKIPMGFFSRLSDAQILAYHKARVEGRCLNCYTAGHQGWQCTLPCAWPMCQGKAVHVAKDCKAPKSAKANKN